MKATGIIRRIDDLGRVVIPKEIRRKMRIVEGDPLEIFYNSQDNAVCFTPYYTSYGHQLNSLASLIKEEAGYSEEAIVISEQLKEIAEKIEEIF